MSRGDDGVRIVRGRRIWFVRRKFELDRRGRLRWVDALGRIHGLPCLDLGTWHSIVVGVLSLESQYSINKIV